MLLTSHRQLKDYEDYLDRALKGSGISVLSQTRFLSKSAVVQKFAEKSEKFVLIGVDSFWEGLDIEGEPLSCVIIPKLPFPVPSDPLGIARIKVLEAEGGKGFFDFSLPLAILKIKQGAGRLIRSKSDLGVLLLLDSRLYSKSYGRNFLKEFASYQQKILAKNELLDEVQRFLRSVSQ